MKHQYFGDVLDYVKYGLLRCFANAGFHVGVCWMLTGNDERPDGHKIQYLRRPDEWKSHDPDLYSHLAEVIGAPDGKHLRHIEGAHQIPHARFYGAMVPDSRAEREIWSKDMLATLSGSDLLFFDPDNGIEIPSKPIGRKDSSKYIYWVELAESWQRTRSLLVFQHFPRVKRDDFIQTRVKEVESHLPGALVIPWRSSNVLFLLAYRPTDAARINAAAENIEAQWSGRVWRNVDIKSDARRQQKPEAVVGC